MQQLSEFVAANWLLFIALVVILILLARTWILPGGMKNIAPAEAIRILNNQEGLLLDVRTEKEYAEGHILNAVNIPVGLLDSRVKEVSDYKDKPVVFCCRTGSRASQAAVALKKQGFNELYNVSGGLMGWQNANLPVTKGSKKDNNKKDSNKKDKAKKNKSK